MHEVEKYYSNLPLSQKKSLKKIEKIILEAVPEATTRMSYGMPCFYYNNRYLLGIAGFKDHMSLFPGAEPIAKLQSKLKKYTTKKGTIQFTNDLPLNDNLIIDVITICLERAKQ